MKSYLLKLGVLSIILFLGWSTENVSAAGVTWASKCEAFGQIKPNQNPTTQQINCLLTNAALEANIPPEVVKAIAAQESGWKQFKDGKPLVSSDGGIGIMQITNQLNYDQEKLKTDITYNIQAGVEILQKFYQRKDLPKIKGVGPEVIENWYFPVMAYNGIKPVNSPLYKDGSGKNKEAYQEKVFSVIEKDSFLSDTKLAEFPFSKEDFLYDTNSDENIIFNKLKYIVTDQMHASNYHFQKGEKVVVTKDNARLRTNIKTTTGSQLLAKNTTLIIDGEFIYDQYNLGNQFVWYPVTSEDRKFAGYISSAYIMEKLEAPTVNPVNEQDKFVIGKAPFSNVLIQILNGKYLVGSAESNAEGEFKVAIPSQKAGATLTITYKDHLNRVSEPASIKVQTHILNGWVDRDGKKYHYTSGVLDTGWFKEGNRWYYLDANGVMQKGWIRDKGLWYYLNANGVMQTGWIKDGSSWYYLSGSGAMKTGWIKDGSSWYYLSSSGAMKTGWLKEGSSWYYLSGSGAMKTGWIKDGSSWYYLSSSGAMKNGWLKEGSSWYYLSSNGAMQTGWQKINGKWYYFYSNGVMAHNTWIGKYRLGPSGAML
ncbi:Ig-like domain-containing protein [Neobacillus sedimentimangrovi]|jgi:glucan-binding YG repeat protein|uniref:Ig-like domain-containing protein n=1 Tax=Neobacillus sedimentimangrovi TaxID=2699460 RepID=A0ABS8QJL7_9BACI|nr:transglycosylase SLT domain-containing protein [Neobacillus sedimentimangrovi]MCD4839479.1 Ig-like domain-containing protein [Neobacillus sedimentimangrovi]